MRLQSRTRPQPLTIREKWRRDRAAAQRLSSAFPAIASIHIHLQFEDPRGRSPASQAHALHPSAHAFFEFPCPYANCDGKFDLSEAVRLATERASAHMAGKLVCPGTRSKDAVTKEPCGLRLSYTIEVEYAR